MTSKIDKLTANNSRFWKQKIELLLALKDLKEFIDPAVEGEETAEWKKKDKKVKAAIGLTLSDEMLENVREALSPMETWKKICACL